MSLAARLINKAVRKAADEAARKLNIDPWSAGRLAPFAAALVLYGLRRRTAGLVGAAALALTLRRNREDLLEGRRLGAGDIRARGEAIADRLFGRNRDRAVRALAEMAGVEEWRAAGLLAMTAAAVMSALAAAKRDLKIGLVELQGVVKSESALIDDADPTLVEELRAWVFRPPMIARALQNARATLVRRLRPAPSMVPAE